MATRVFVSLAIGSLLAAMLWAPANASDRNRVSAQDLASLANIGRVSISPNGRYVVYQVYQGDPTTNRWTSRWILNDTATGKSRVIVRDGGSPILTYEDHTAYVTDQARRSRLTTAPDESWWQDVSPAEALEQVQKLHRTVAADRYLSRELALGRHGLAR